MLPPDLRSLTITSARLPAGLSYPTLHDRMKARGFVIYGGQGRLSEEAFRIANMGHWSEERLVALQTALRESLA
jgi:2-aminoethylphosphonate-pyruvate transaminase